VLGRRHPVSLSTLVRNGCPWGSGHYRWMGDLSSLLVLNRTVTGEASNYLCYLPRARSSTVRWSERREPTPRSSYEVHMCSQHVGELNKELMHWEYIYDCVRPHEALNYRTPLQFLRGHGIVVNTPHFGLICSEGKY